MTYSVYSMGDGWYARTSTGAIYIEIMYVYRPAWHRSSIRTVDFLTESPVLVAKNVVFK